MRTARLILSRIFVFTFWVLLAFMVYLLVRGTRIDLGFVRLKHLVTPFRAAFVLYALSVIVHPDFKQRLVALREGFVSFCKKAYAKWVLISAFCALFIWQQIANYLSVNINFLPFSFYDYMLYYFFKGKLFWTGWLHDYYHVNTLLYVLAPLWLIVKSPWLLVIAHGVILAASAIPLYGIVRLKFEEEFVPFLIAFVYLSYTFLQSVLAMDFSVEGFYPLLLFSLIYFVMKKKIGLVFLFALLTYLIKDDAPIYVGALGGFLLLTKEYRRYGFILLVFSAAAFFVIMKFVVPHFGKMSQRLAENYPQYGKGTFEVIGHLLKNPLEIVRSVFWPPEKLKTYFKIFRYLLFVPFASPWVLLVFASAFPVMMTSRPGIFLDISCHYSAPALAFIFVALTFGLANVARWSGKRRKAVLWTLLLLMIFLNGGRYTVESVTPGTLKTIEIAKSIPQDCDALASGALLPYLGYRDHNFYIARVYEYSGYGTRKYYLKPDYCLLVDNIPLFPASVDDIYALREKFLQDDNYELTYKDEHRWLFKKRIQT